MLRITAKITARDGRPCLGKDYLTRSKHSLTTLPLMLPETHVPPIKYIPRAKTNTFLLYDTVLSRVHTERLGVRCGQIRRYTPKREFSLSHTIAETHMMHEDEEQVRSQNKLQALDFNDPTSAHGSKTMFGILQAMLVFKFCQFGPLVKNAEAILSWSERIIGTTITRAIVRSTFFSHFCGGEDVRGIQPVISSLKKNGIGGILDYAAENEGEGITNNGGGDGIVANPPYNQPARVYDYKSEADCDRHVEIFLSCVHAVRDVSPDGFAALKVTALGNPLLLERMSSAIVEAKNLFSKFDLDGDGVISRGEFEKCYRLYFDDGDEKLPRLLKTLDPNNTGTVDYIEWSKLLTPYDLYSITSSCREVGPLALATPSAEEIDLIKAMRSRLFTLAEEASKCGTRLLIDAEQTKFQPAIDNLVLELQQTFNATNETDVPIIFNTYQCYLKDTSERIRIDLERSKRHSYHFAAKLVRGAYMLSERERAEEMGYPSPIHDSAEDTHTCYDESVEYLLQHRTKNRLSLEIMCASHNQNSIQKTIEQMVELGITPEDSAVHFAQLYGMSDNLTYTLGGHGFRAYKYVPYGQVNEVMPYLMRRAQENSDMLGNASKEISMLYRELKRRFT